MQTVNMFLFWTFMIIILGWLLVNYKATDSIIQSAGAFVGNQSLVLQGGGNFGSGGGLLGGLFGGNSTNYLAYPTS